MTTPILPQTHYVTVDGVAYRASGYDTLDDLAAAVSEAISTGATLQLDVTGRQDNRDTHGTLFLIGSRVGAVAVSEINLFDGQHGTDGVPGPQGTE